MSEFIFIIIGILISILLLVIFASYRRGISNYIIEDMNKANNKATNECIELENKIYERYRVLIESYHENKNTMTKSNAEQFINILQRIIENHPELKNFFDKLNR